MRILHLARLLVAARPLRALLGTLTFLPIAMVQADPAPPRTLAEQSGWLRTGRYAEVESLCAAWQRAHPAEVRCTTFGRTPEGRPMLALIVSQSGALTPEAARRKNLPVVLIQGGIHAGEIDGKDAGFEVLRDLLAGKAAPGALKKQVWIFVPVFNVDGHERFGAWNRPNQRGPEQMGWRTTAQNFNLNRDYVKADAPEMRAMLALVQRWDPLAEVDLHVTDGAQFEHDVSVTAEPVNSGDLALRTAGRAWRDGVIADLAAQGSLPLAFYPSFIVDDDPASGFRDGVPPPRFSNGYYQLRNRFGLLVETHSWKDYPTRVRITRNTIVSVLQSIAQHGGEWQRLAREADARSAALAGAPVALDYAATGKVRTVDFRGYAYTRTLSPVSGALMTRYDERKPEVWHLPLYDDVQPTVTVIAPQAGYLVPPIWADAVAAKLAVHGIAFERIARALPPAQVQVFHADASASGVRFAKQSFESHQGLKLSGEWRDGNQAVPASALFVPIAQPKARLVMMLLEPTAPDSLLAWGFFNGAFERKEYMEPYVAEAVAEEQLAADPLLAQQFQALLGSDPAFAKSPEARLEFFERRHASWDVRYAVYPVTRLATVPNHVLPGGRAGRQH